jgi:hypothetical protein
MARRRRTRLADVHQSRLHLTYVEVSTMAPYTQAPAWNVSFVFRDNNDKYSAVGASVGGLALFAEVQATADALAVALEAISNARLFSYSIERVFRNDVTTAPPPESEVERKLRIPLGTAAFPDVTYLEIPSPVFTIETPGTDIVDNANALVAAVIDEVLTGAALPGNGWATYYGADLTRAGTPFIMHRNRKKKA